MDYLHQLLTKPHYLWTMLDSLTALAAFAFLLLAVSGICSVINRLKKWGTKQ